MANDTLKTDFCIIGFPNCGTTTLAKHLQGFASIHLARLGGQIDSPFFNGSNESLSSALVKGKKNGHCCASYIYSLTSLKKIYEANPSTLFIVCVRDAAESLRSWHVLHQKMAVDDRAKGHITQQDPASRRFYANSTIEEYYEQFARTRLEYTERLKMIGRNLPEIRPLIISYSVLLVDPRMVVTRIHRLLGIAPTIGELAKLPEKSANSAPKFRTFGLPYPIMRELTEQNKKLREHLNFVEGSERLILEGDEQRMY